MAKKDTIRLQAKVIDALPNAMFKVELETDTVVLATLKGIMRRRYVRVFPGDRVRVETPRGRIEMPAKIARVVHPGSIRIAWGWGDLNQDYNLNCLTDDDRRNPIIGTPSGRSFMCRISKVE